MPRTTSSATPLQAANGAANGVPNHRELGGNRATARVLLILSQFAGGSASRGVSELSCEREPGFRVER